ncbi:TetR/AcrR family transcriptional regulator [bacterium]|nr:TetR/AcrR family transcriptional regulator [bacterium]MBU4511401.1 TetR/AcrR family transcriptional regulator [bacterium]
MVQAEFTGSTKDKIIESAKDLFSSYNYRDVSISMITEHAGINGSLFYRHFSNKTDILEQLVTNALKNLKVQVASLVLPKEKTSKSLDIFYKWMADAAYQNLRDIRILHEVELNNADVARQLQWIFDSPLQKFLAPQVQEFGLDVVRWFVLGPVRFSITYYTIWKGMEFPKECFSQLTEFVLHGLDPEDHIMNHRVFDYGVEPIEIQEDKTKLKLLQSAEKLFGSRGFKETKVSDITYKAGVALGTFYLYFENKQAILEKLVWHTNTNLRRTLKQAINNFLDRRDAEIAGFYAFLQFFKKHSNMYAVVRDAEFFANDVAMEYYEKIKQSYIKPIKQAQTKGEFRVYDPEILALSLMGIGHYMGMDMLILGKKPDIDFVRNLIKLSRILYKGVKRYELEKDLPKKEGRN